MGRIFFPIAILPPEYNWSVQYATSPTGVPLMSRPALGMYHGATPGAAVHELGHHLENSNPTVLTASARRSSGSCPLWFP
jgi:hypothetical protein